MAIASDTDVRSYAEVDLSPRTACGSHFYIDATSAESMRSAVLVLMVFLVVNAYTAIGCPTYLGDKVNSMKLKGSRNRTVHHAELNIGRLRAVHRVIKLNCSFISNHFRSRWELPVQISVRTVTMNDSAILFDAGESRRNVSVSFSPGHRSSRSLFLVQEPVTDFDALRVKVSVTGNFTDIRGLKFVWRFRNQDAVKYLSTSDLLVSFLIGYMLIAFVGYLRFDGESFTQCLLIIVGVTGVLSSNPLRLIIGDHPVLEVIDHVLMAIFNAVFRMFLLVELELLRGRYATFRTSTMAALALLFGVYAALEAAAGYDRQGFTKHVEEEVAVILHSEWALMWAHIIYYAIGFSYCYIAKCMNDGMSPTRLWYISGAMVGTGVTTLLTQVVCVLTNTAMFSIVLQLTLHSMMGTFAAMTLFLFHTGGEQEYKELEPVNAEKFVLEVDQLSDDDDSEEEDDDLMMAKVNTGQ